MQSDMFQDDIFPPCEAGEPSLTVEEWMDGKNRDPKLVKFTEDGLEPIPGVVDVSVQYSGPPLIRPPIKVSWLEGCFRGELEFGTV